MVTPWRTTASFRSHVDDHAARLHALDHVGGDQPGRGLARDQGGGDDDVRLLGLLGVHLALGLLEALAHHLGIAAAAGPFFLILDLDEFAAQRLDLVGHFGTGVVGAHDGAEAGSSADRRQAGHAGTGDEDLGRRNLARGCDLAVEEAAECVGGLDDGAVAGNAGLRGQRVHLLGAAQHARQRVDGQHGDLARRELLHQFRVLRRPDEADQGLALVHQADFFSGRGENLQDEVGSSPQLGRALHDLRACGAVDIVAEIGRIAGAGLDDDLESELDELFNDFGHGRNALFAGCRFLRDSDKQRFLGRLGDGNTGFTRRGFGRNANLHGGLSSLVETVVSTR
jgi:hypothetical protein